MDSDALLELSRQLEAEGKLSVETREQLRLISDQLQLLQTDEAQAGHAGEVAERRNRLKSRFEKLVRTAELERLAPLGSRTGYRDGAILALRFADDLALSEAIGGSIERRLAEAFDRTRALPGIELPEIEVVGGAADLWLFAARPPNAGKADVLRACLCLGLMVQRRLATVRSAPAVLLDWEGDAAYYTRPFGRTVLSLRLRAAQEALLGARPGHVLLSQEGRRSMALNSGPVSGPLLGPLSAVLDCPDARLICTLEQLPPLTPSDAPAPMFAVSYTGDGELLAGSSSAYVELTAIEHRENVPGRRPGEPFIRLLSTHDECVIVGITHEDLAERYLMPALADRRKAGRDLWRRMVVIFASEAAASRVLEEREDEERRQCRAGGLRSVISFLRSEDRTGRSWKVAEYEDNLPFVGNWMSGGSRNSIRLSPLLPGCDVAKTFVVELAESTVAYQEAQQAFLAIEERSVQVGEWNLRGRGDRDGFCWTGIVPHGAGPERSEAASFKAVVLIIVHGVTSRGRRVYLQLRSKLNASSDFGLYSNISGMVAVQDAYTVADVPLPPLIAPEDADALMGHILRNGVLALGSQVPQEVWLQAAVREVGEELGLHVDASRLKDHGSLTRVVPDKGVRLFFRIFSLELASRQVGRREEAEIQAIRHRRKGVGMDDEFTVGDIRRLQATGALNGLLNDNCEHFIRLYQELGIPDE